MSAATVPVNPAGYSPTRSGTRTLSTTDPEPRRLTPTERLHDLARIAIERQRLTHASFSIKQTKGVGGATVIEWDVEVPVCDEYPTAEQAFTAAIDFADRLLVNYPPEPNDAAASATRKAHAVAYSRAKSKGAAA